MALHLFFFTLWMSRYMTKPTKWPIHPAKTQISLGDRPVWPESSLCALWVVKDPVLLHADSEASDQTGRMPKLIWVFAGHTRHLFVLSCAGSLWYHVHELLYHAKNRSNQISVKWSQTRHFLDIRPALWPKNNCKTDTCFCLEFFIGILMSFRINFRKFQYYFSTSEYSLHHLLYHLSHSMTKPTKWPVCPAKTSINLCISHSLIRVSCALNG